MSQITSNIGNGTDTTINYHLEYSRICSEAHRRVRRGDRDDRQMFTIVAIISDGTPHGAVLGRSQTLLTLEEMEEELRLVREGLRALDPNKMFDIYAFPNMARVY